MRCFIAVEVDEPQVRSFIEELSGVSAALRVVRPENLHLTLKFLGEVPGDSIDCIVKAVEGTLSGFSPFETSLVGTGAFPSLDYMRVVWVGFGENRERFVEMQKAVDEALVPLGFAPEKRFHPHLTLARMKSQKGKGQLKEFLLKNQERAFGTLTVDSVRLKKSVLTPKGPIYSTERETRLTG
ncbi:MAG: RNA 2',3'-cyclic phosphodiesterase [Candidatus Hydrothermarchaeaceae archaeon]